MTLASPGRDRAKARPTARRDRVSGRPRRISPRRDPDRPVSGCPTRDSRSTSQQSGPEPAVRCGTHDDASRGAGAQIEDLFARAVSGNCGCRPAPIGSGAHGIGDDLRGHANHRFSIVGALPPRITGFCMLTTVMAAGHCTAFSRARGSLVSVPAAGPEVRPRRAVRLEGSGVMRTRRDAARPSKPLALPLTFSPSARGHRHDDGQKRGSPQGITDR